MTTNRINAKSVIVTLFAMLVLCSTFNAVAQKYSAGQKAPIYRHDPCGMC
jgi:hypothetical protein